MKITHHLDETTIIALAAGTLGEAHGFAAATHVAYCPLCRAALRDAETIGGQIMQDDEPRAVTDTCRAATLASLDAIAAAPAKKSSGPRGEVPAVLCNLLDNAPLDSLKWKTIVPGVSTYEIPLPHRRRRR